MRVTLINPNSTVAMTKAMTQVAQTIVPEIAFEGWTSHDGPSSIQGPDDGARAEPHLLRLVDKANAGGTDGIIIGCFDDTALQIAASRSTCPVLGIGQAAYHYAALRGWRFSVVTTLAVSVPVLESNIRALGLEGYLGRVRASDVPVLALHEDPQIAEHKVIDEARRAEAEDDVDAVILGCGGMVSVAQAVRKSVGLQVIDPMVVTATCMKWML